VVQEACMMSALLPRTPVSCQLQALAGSGLKLSLSGSTLKVLKPTCSAAVTIWKLLRHSRSSMDGSILDSACASLCNTSVCAANGSKSAATIKRDSGLSYPIIQILCHMSCIILTQGRYPLR